MTSKLKIVDSGRNCTGYLGFYGFCRVYESSLGGTPMRVTFHAAESKLMPAAARAPGNFRRRVLSCSSSLPTCSFTLRLNLSGTGTAGKLSKIKIGAQAHYLLTVSGDQPAAPTHLTDHFFTLLLPRHPHFFRDRALGELGSDFQSPAILALRAQ